jgi:dienelactone hydrolase
LAIQSEAWPYVHDGTGLTGYLVWDDAAPGRRPGVLVFHGGAGLDDHARARARGFASLGYVALAVDLYGDVVRGGREAVLRRIHRFQQEPAYLRELAQAWLVQLAGHRFVADRCAAVGYCLGGMTTLELARSGANLAAAVSVHGGLRTTAPADVATIKARVLVCHGAIDPHVPMAHVQQFTEEMTAAQADWQLNVYGGAMHGFTHEASAAQTPGVAYNAAADSRSSAAVAALLAEAFAV